MFSGFSGGSDSEESAHRPGHSGSIPGSGKFPGEGNGNPLQYSCLENFMDRRALQAIGHVVRESDVTEQPNKHTHKHTPRVSVHSHNCR